MEKTNDEKKYCVYMHRFANNKVYIGQTCQDPPERRWGINGNKYLRKNENGEFQQPLIANAILKYGWDTCEHIILFENLSRNDVDRIEQLCIALFRSNEHKYGYNIDLGGSSKILSEETKIKISNTLKELYSDPTKIPMYGRKMSSESKQKMSIAQKKRFENPENHPMYGKHLSDEVKQKMSEARKGKNTGEDNYFYGHHHSEETKRKISQTKKENYIKENHPNYGKPLTEETKQKIADSHKGKKLTELHKQKIGDSERGYKNPIAKAVCCIENGLIFLTIKEAAQHYNIVYTSISLCCSGKQKTAGGYRWRYATQDEIIAEKQHRGIEVS